MKKLTAIIILFVFAACSKTKDTTVTSESPAQSSIQMEAKKFNCVMLPLPMNKRKPNNPGQGGGGNGGGNNPPPPDTTTRVDNVIYVNYNGGINPPSGWSTNELPYANSGLSPDGNKLVVEKLAAAMIRLNVVVTDRKSKFDSTPISKRQQLNLTTTNFFSPYAGGVAFWGSFGTDEVTWIFTSSLNYNVANIYQASPHEIGHTLNCWHQGEWDFSCTLLNSYRFGCTMGNPYGLTSANWIVGPTDRDCYSRQDDLWTMAQRVGWKI